jgi:large subunit ribosomal protein L28
MRLRRFVKGVTKSFDNPPHVAYADPDPLVAGLPRKSAPVLFAKEHLMAQKCMISGKRPERSNLVSHSNHRTVSRQEPNLQWKRFFLADENRWVRLRVSTKVMKTISRYGLKDTIKRYGASEAILH